MISCVAGTLTHYVRIRMTAERVICCPSRFTVCGRVEQPRGSHGDLVSRLVYAFSLIITSLSNSITEEPSIGNLRFITRLDKTVLPNGTLAADVEGGTVIEGQDVFLVDGQTRSKC